MEVLHKLGKDWERYIHAMFAEQNNNNLRNAEVAKIEELIKNGAKAYSIENSENGVKIGYKIVISELEYLLFKRL